MACNQVFPKTMLYSFLIIRFLAGILLLSVQIKMSTYTLDASLGEYFLKPFWGYFYFVVGNIITT